MQLAAGGALGRAAHRDARDPRRSSRKPGWRSSLGVARRCKSVRRRAPPRRPPAPHRWTDDPGRRRWRSRSAGLRPRVVPGFDDGTVGRAGRSGVVFLEHDLFGLRACLRGRGGARVARLLDVSATVVLDFAWVVSRASASGTTTGVSLGRPAFGRPRARASRGGVTRGLSAATVAGALGTLRAVTSVAGTGVVPLRFPDR